MSDSRKSNKKLVTILIIVSLLLIVVPFIALKGAEFGGSDDAGSQMVNEVTGKEYTPWFTPILENFIGGEIPGEIESLIFCVQTGIGVGIISYCFGYLA
ncbi:MAG: energy-coupling factor ABC transporter substrate-binding protein, partial [[Clostridium] scindens]